MFLRERWRQVPSLPFIQASSFGRIRVIPHKVPMPNGHGVRTYASTSKTGFGRWDGHYYKYWVHRNRKDYYVSRLVCEAFHGPAPPGQPFCIHRDENARNNKPGNLKWAAQSENMRDAPKYKAYVNTRPRHTKGTFI